MYLCFKIMKNINVIMVFVVAFLYSVVLSAQVNVYIEPTIQAKIGISSTSSSSSHKKLMNQAYYTKFETKSLRMSGIPIGLNIGLSFNNEKQRLNVGFISEKATIGYDATARPVPPAEAQYGVDIESMVDVSYIRLNLLFEQRLYSRKTKDPWYVVAGVGLALNNKINFLSSTRHGNLEDTDTVGTMILEDVRKPSLSLKVTPSLTIGVKKDFYSQKGKYLLSSSLFYTHGMENIVDMKVLHYTAVGTDRRIVGNDIYSKGSGVYLQVSRRLNIPFDTKKKEDLEQYYE